MDTAHTPNKAKPELTHSDQLLLMLKEPLHQEEDSLKLNHPLLPQEETLLPTRLRPPQAVPPSHTPQRLELTLKEELLPM